MCNKDARIITKSGGGRRFQKKNLLLPEISQRLVPSWSCQNHFICFGPIKEKGVKMWSFLFRVQLIKGFRFLKNLNTSSSKTRMSTIRLKFSLWPRWSRHYSVFTNFNSSGIQNKRIIRRASVHQWRPGSRTSWCGAYNRIIYAGEGKPRLNSSEDVWLQ